MFSSVSVAAILAVFFGIYVFMKGKEKHKPDYYGFFLLGAVWLLIGIVLRDQPLIVLGTIFTATGLWNRNKWREDKRKWEDLNKEEKKIKITILVLFFILFFIGLVFYLGVEKEFLF